MDATRTTCCGAYVEGKKQVMPATGGHPAQPRVRDDAEKFALKTVALYTCFGSKSSIQMRHTLLVAVNIVAEIILFMCALHIEISNCALNATE